jgi:hypothetical protein
MWGKWREILNVIKKSQQIGSGGKRLDTYVLAMIYPANSKRIMAY